MENNVVSEYLLGIELDLASFEVLKDGKTHQIRLTEVSA